MAFKAIARDPVYVQVADQIRQAILERELAPGDALPPERELSETFGVSRASIREAFRALQAQGLIRVTGAPARAVVNEEIRGPARDALINMLRLNRIDFGDVIDFRCLVEAATVRLAAGNGHEAALGPARTALEAMRDTTEIEAFDEADVRFHVALADASRNGAMHLVVEALRGAMSPYLLEELRAESSAQPTLRRLTTEHAAILKAVEARQPDKAARLMEKHIRGAYRRFVLRATDGETGGDASNDASIVDASDGA
jgi:GntR family transcriptional regulator, transcriptional repressor for pyruvate dehydrogenase complex